MKKIGEAWFVGLKTPEEREEMKEFVLSQEKVLDKLREMLYNIQVSKESSVLGDYDTPSWSHKQAHLNGESAMLRKVIDLVTFKERDDRPQT